MKTLLIVLSVILTHSSWAQPKPLNSFEKIQAAFARQEISKADKTGLTYLGLYWRFKASVQSMFQMPELKKQHQLMASLVQSCVKYKI